MSFMNKHARTSQRTLQTRNGDTFPKECEFSKLGDALGRDSGEPVCKPWDSDVNFKLPFRRPAFVELILSAMSCVNCQAMFIVRRCINLPQPSTTRGRDK